MTKGRSRTQAGEFSNRLFVGVRASATVVKLRVLQSFKAALVPWLEWLAWLHADSHTLQGVQLLSQIQGSCTDPRKRPVFGGVS